jgi:hypothetical protein
VTCPGIDAGRAEALVRGGRVDVVAFGRKIKDRVITILWDLRGGRRRMALDDTFWTVLRPGVKSCFEL